MHKTSQALSFIDKGWFSRVYLDELTTIGVDIKHADVIYGETGLYIKIANYEFLKVYLYKSSYSTEEVDRKLFIYHFLSCDDIKYSIKSNYDIIHTLNPKFFQNRKSAIDINEEKFRPCESCIEKLNNLGIFNWKIGFENFEMKFIKEDTLDLVTKDMRDSEEFLVLSDLSLLKKDCLHCGSDLSDKNNIRLRFIDSEGLERYRVSCSKCGNFI